jgi:hypothetical protein
VTSRLGTGKSLTFLTVYLHLLYREEEDKERGKGGAVDLVLADKIRG